MDKTLIAVLSYLPPPTSSSIDIAATASTCLHGDDHISRLPNTLLRRVVSCLPNKDAARTTAISSRERRVWAYTPLRLDEGGGLAPGVVTTALAAHTGLDASARLASAYLASVDPNVVPSWFISLAAKEIGELVVVNESCTWT